MEVEEGTDRCGCGVWLCTNKTVVLPGTPALSAVLLFLVL